MSAARKDNPTVYSTEHGRMCPQCGKPVDRCICSKKKPTQPSPKRDGIVRLYLERKGRGGKTVTIVTGLPITESALKDLAKELKRSCGTGGAVKEGNIEIQGDHRDHLLPLLEQKGYQVKKAGG